MRFKGYKYSFRFNASHYNDIETKGVHSHTFEIALYIDSLNTDSEVIAFETLESKVKDYLSQFSGKLINEIPPFDKIMPTIENIGSEFFKRIASVLHIHEYHLLKLEIGESPQRTYTISEEDLTEEQLATIYNAIKKYRVEDNEKNNQEVSVKQDLSEQESAVAPQIKEAPPEVEAEPQPFNIADPIPQGAIGQSNKASNLTFFISLLILIVGGFGVMMAVKISGIYPLGFDIHGHLFKSDLMYSEISKGNLYPLYTEYWYNGLEPFRYWPPMPYYFMSLLQFIGNGDVINAYLGFIWASFTIGGLGWIMLGKKLQRPILGLFFGVIWFFLPDNIRVFFSEGNLPRMFITMILPILFYYVWMFVNYKKKKTIFPIIFLMLIVILGHLMISAMVGVATTIFLLIYSIANKRYKESSIVVGTMLSSFALAGIWVYPSLVGGMVSMESGGSDSIALMLSRKLSVSLNPFLRYFTDITELYYGLIIAIIAVIGLFVANKKSLPGFLSLLIVIAGSTTALAPLMKKLPLGELFWMRRFAPIAYAVFVIALIEWKEIKRSAIVVLCILLLADVVPSALIWKYDEKMDIPSTVSDFDKTNFDYLFTQAKEITSQRVSLMDLSGFGPLPSYTFGSVGKKTPYVFGWAWQGATTAYNISALNEALERSDFLYVFDRNLELGADTVIIQKSRVVTPQDRENLMLASSEVGYKLAGESDNAILFSLYRDEGNFGVISDYRGLAIGTTARLVPGILHYYRPGDKVMIDDYTIDELLEYDMIYLSGFFYKDKALAEKNVREIARKGVKVYVDMSRIPSDPLTSRMTFLDVSAQPITFYNKFPELITNNNVIAAQPFDERDSVWNTVYLNSLKQTDGYAWFEDSKIDFIGTGDTENITFIGFNILYHSFTTYDEGVGSILNSVMNIDRAELPNRQIVPLTISYGKNKITIESEYDNVNTTLAYHDNFNSEQEIKSINNMLIVNKGTTVIYMTYPHLIKGIIVSVIGLGLISFCIFLTYKKTGTVDKNKEGE